MRTGCPRSDGAWRVGRQSCRLGCVRHAPVVDVLPKISAVNHFNGHLVQEAMKTTTLRILFTLAILAGLAAAPAAQTFRWQAGSQNDEARVRARAQVAV